MSRLNFRLTSTLSRPTAALLLAAGLGAEASAQQLYSASGSVSGDIAATVQAFRAALGEANPPQPVSFPDGFRSIDWDGAPDAVSAPNAFPGDFFNADVSPRARGIEFTTPGSGFQLSATAASGVGIEFDNLKPALSELFTTFSPERLFTPLGSTVTDVYFFVPGTQIPAASRGFGAVFTDVDLATSTRLEFYDRDNRLLETLYAPVGSTEDESLSFIGALFAEAEVYRVRIYSGSLPVDGALYEDIASGYDLVVMDDFIFGEPQPLDDFAITTATGSNPEEISAAVESFRSQFGAANPNEPISLPDGSRSIDWDGAPDVVSAPNPFPGDFFNADVAPRARGVEFVTRGSELQLSATAESGAGIEFDNVQFGLSDDFSTFSPQRLFTALGATTVEATFFVPGTQQVATSRGFGAVFTDVDLADGTTIAYYGIEGNLITTLSVPVGPSGDESLSFAGIFFEEPIIARVTIKSGTNPIDGGDFDNPAIGIDLVVMDDFIFGEPQPTLLGNAAADFDLDDIPNGVEVKEGTNPYQKDNDVFNNNRLFVMQTYRDFLVREGDKGGILFWTDVLDRLGLEGRIALVKLFLDSPEFIAQINSRFPGQSRTEAEVAALYVGTLLRDPDPAGFTYWVNAFNTGVPRDGLIQSFIVSPEYSSRFLP